MSWFNKDREYAQLRREYMGAQIAVQVSDTKIELLQQKVRVAQEQIEWLEQLSDRYTQVQEMQNELHQFVKQLLEEMNAS